MVIFAPVSMGFMELNVSSHRPAAQIIVVKMEVSAAKRAMAWVVCARQDMKERIVKSTSMNAAAIPV